MAGFGMTRRQFLHRFGLMSSSSMVFGAMDAWDLMGQAKAVKPDLPRLSSDSRVVILGAGLAGLAVGWELAKLGHEVRLLEARDRVGGLAHTVRRGTTETELTGETQVCQFDEGMYFNAGAWRIPHSHDATLGYCRELGVPLQAFIDEHDDAILYYEGERFGELSGRRLRLREIKADMRGYTAELLAKALDQRLLDVELSAEDVERLVGYLVSDGSLSNTDGVYRGGRARGDGPPWDLAALLQSGLSSRARAVEVPGANTPPMFQPIGGMDQIPAAFGRALGDRITLRAEVRTVRQSEAGVTVVYRDTGTGAEHEVTGDYVVCALPMTILRNLDIDLSPQMRAAVAGVTHINTAKIGLQMKRRFWEEDDGIFGGSAYTNLPLGDFAYPSNDFFAAKGVLLGYYGSGSTNGLSGRPVADRIQHVIEHASKFHPQMRDEFDTGYASFWVNIRYSEGAYASNPGDRLSTLTQADGRIYMGSAAAGTSPAWMQGAFAAAWSTVERLHSRVLAG